MDNLLKGKEVAEAIDNYILGQTDALYNRGIVPTLAIVRVGENPSDMAYETGAVKKAKKLGLQAEKYICSSDIIQEDLISVIESINNNSAIHGILLLQPLPNHIDANAIRNSLSIEKDLDCISDDSLARLFTNDSGEYPPCTAESCIEILKYHNIPIEGKKIVVIGRSMVIGKPVAMMLLKCNATVTICHSKTSHEDLIKYCKDADVIISATGHENTLTEEMVRSNQAIIDVGISFTNDGKMIGDVDFEGVKNVVKHITPVPGGVGSVTTSILMKHLVIAASK